MNPHGVTGVRVKTYKTHQTRKLEVKGMFAAIWPHAQHQIPGRPDPELNDKKICRLSKTASAP